MKHPLFLALLCMTLLVTADVLPIQMDNGGGSLMNAYVNGSYFSPMSTRYCTRDFANGTTGKRLKIHPNSNFTDYDSKEGAIVVQNDRFWLIGGSGTVNNKRWQPTGIIQTATISPDGVMSEMKRIRALPYQDKHLRALIHANRLYVLGGSRHNDLVSAPLLPDGELGEWTVLPAYPTVVAQGGFVYYKGCLYANGKSTWRPGSSKMYALKLKEDGTALRKWERVDSPENAQGFLMVHNDALYYFDSLSGNIFKTTQEGEDDVQLKEWTVAGTMPCPPRTGSVEVIAVPDGWLVCGGELPRGKDKKFAGFFKAAFIPFNAVK